MEAGAGGGATVVNEAADDVGIMGLPPGFRFHPTDEEIITHYLTPKVINNNFSAPAIGQVDLNKCEPWDLPKKAKMGEKEWFFFCQRDRKYPTGMRTNRATDSGYWKATGKDKEILRQGKSGNLVGMKKTLVFYKGRAPKGEKTNWVMHEFRLEGRFSYYNIPRSSKDEWVVCRVFHKGNGIMKRSPTTDDHGGSRINSLVDELLDSPPWMPPLTDPNPVFDDKPGSSYVANDSSNNNNNNNNFFGFDDKFKSETENYLSSYISTTPQVMQRGGDHHHDQYKPTTTAVCSPYTYNFNTNTYQPSILNLQQNNHDHSHIRASSSYAYQSSGMGRDVYSLSALDNYDIIQNERSMVVNASKASDLDKGGNGNGVKVEQSKISVSQETGASTDMTAEISSSSILSKQAASGNISSYDHHPDRSSLLSDLDSLLEF